MFLTIKLLFNSYCGRHRPALISDEIENEPFPFAWTPPNARNKATVFRLIFSKYTNTTYPVSKHAISNILIEKKLM